MMRALCAVGAFGLAGACMAAPLTVRIAPRGGAPCITVNGKPVRARMFFGGVASAPIILEPGERTYSYEFAAKGAADATGTLHFRFGQMPGAVRLDNIRIVDVAAGADVVPPADFEQGAGSFARDWASWPEAARNTVGAVRVAPGEGERGSACLRIDLAAPVDGVWPDFHIYHAANLSIVQGRRYRVSFWAGVASRREVISALYRPGASYAFLGGPENSFDRQIRLAGDVGVRFVSFPIETPWPEPGQSADFSGVDAVCRQVLAANPDALLLPRFGAEPPEWWRNAHPDDTMRWEDGSRQSHGIPASPLFRRDAAARVAALVEHLEEEFGQHMAGYHPCGQNTGEWFYQNTWENLLNGYSPGDAAAWRAWLTRRYRSDEALRQAWRRPGAQCATADVPTPAERRSAPNGVLRDPGGERALVDWAEFQQDAMVGLVCDLAHAARTASGGRKLITFFYGYVFEFGPIVLGPSTSGHYALRRALNCPDIDLLCSPISYFDRGVGGSAPAMTAAESVALAGKMWLYEDDTRTHLGTGNFPGQYDGALNPAETYTMLLRNVAQESTRNFATWWMDLAMTGWFNDPGMWAQMAAMRAVDERMLRAALPYRPEVAAVIDEPSMLATSAKASPVTDAAIYKVRRPLARMGAPYGQYLLDDVIAGRVPARLLVFLNAWRLGAAQRRAILRAAQGRSRIWCYAPGAYDESGPTPTAMRELTGFAIRAVSPGAAMAKPTPAGRRLGLTAPFGVDGPVAPLFAVADAGPGETLATYPDGSAAVALRRAGGGWSLFVGVPGLTSELLRLMARRAGVHLYAGVDCNVYANGPLVAIHAAQTGPISLEFGGKGPVRDGLTGRVVGMGPRVDLKVQKGDTRVFLR